MPLPCRPRMPYGAAMTVETPPEPTAPTGERDSPHRFHEDRASSTLRGAAQTNTLADLEAGIAAIREVVQTLPMRPGVYRMQDARGDVLYVGKARALRNRVANYVAVERLPLRLKRMVSQCRAMTIVTTNSEAEALLLEAQLIKKFRPPYNVLLRDDKSFPFILLRADHDFATTAGHRRDDDAIEPRAVLADDLFHLGIDVAGFVACLDAELHQPELGLVRDVGRTSLDHDRPADRLECRHRFGARPA